MSGAEIALAASLIVAAPGTPYPPVATEEWPGVQAALWHVAIDWELMDPRETHFMLTRPEDLREDLDILRRRCAEFRGAPLVGDSRRFPDREAVNDMISFNRALRKHIDARQHVDTDRGGAYRAALRETDRLYQVWDAVRDARCEFYYVTTRRQALKKVRDLIGAEAYQSGSLPPYVPTWRFQETE
jgi:hypothetical protein